MKRGPKANTYGATEEDYTTNYAQEYRKCSKANCTTCREGQGHGPYWFSYHYSPAVQRRIKTYIGKHKPEHLNEHPGEAAPLPGAPSQSLGEGSEQSH